MEESGSKNEHGNVIHKPEMIRLGKLELPSPPEIQRGNFDHEAAVQSPSLNSFPKMEIDFPKLISLEQKYVMERFSASDISRALKLSEAELYMSILESEQKLRFRLFGRLDKLFHRKANDTQTI
ncbi:MAG: hypothetical protein ACO1O6_09105 [Bacteroidota bacterium]